MSLIYDHSDVRGAESLTHPKGCPCLVCTQRRETEVSTSGGVKRNSREAHNLQISGSTPVTATKVADAAGVVACGKTPSLSTDPERKPFAGASTHHTGILVIGQSKRLDCEASISTSGQSANSRDRGRTAAHRPAQGTPVRKQESHPSFNDDEFLYLAAEPGRTELLSDCCRLQTREDDLDPARGVIFAVCMGGIFMLSLMMLIFCR